MKIQDLNDSFERRVIEKNNYIEQNPYDLDVNVDWILDDEQNQTAHSIPELCSTTCAVRTTTICQTQTCKNCKVPYI